MCGSPRGVYGYLRVRFQLLTAREDLKFVL